MTYGVCSFHCGNLLSIVVPFYERYHVHTSLMTLDSYLVLVFLLKWPFDRGIIRFPQSSGDNPLNFGHYVISIDVGAIVVWFELMIDQTESKRVIIGLSSSPYVEIFVSMINGIRDDKKVCIKILSCFFFILCECRPLILFRNSSQFYLLSWSVSRLYDFLVSEF